MVVGEKLSQLRQEKQAGSVDTIDSSGIYPSKIQAEQFREFSEVGELTEGKVYAFLQDWRQREGGQQMQEIQFDYYPGMEAELDTDRRSGLIGKRCLGLGKPNII